MNVSDTGTVLLYLCYWGLSDGLTQATAIPNLKMLLDSDRYRCIIFVTIERHGSQLTAGEWLPSSKKLVHCPLQSRNIRPNLLNKVDDFLQFPRQLELLIRKEQVTKVIARGAPAGALVYRVCERHNVPLFVESFEPHAEYMEESGVWKRWDPRYLFEKYWERATARVAAGLMPVAINYQHRLVKEGITADKIRTVPCPVDFDLFRFDAHLRQQVRRHLHIPGDAPVAIYVGKFGGTYYDQESFLLYQHLFAASPLLHLIILSPDPPATIFAKIHAFKLPKERIIVRSVPHREVAGYLSAADFGLATIKPSPSKLFCSAIKVGEYWACGLPVLITPGIGDDSEFIAGSNAGVVLDPGWMQKGLSYFQQVIGQLFQYGAHRSGVEQVARERRGLSYVAGAYRYFELL